MKVPPPTPMGRAAAPHSSADVPRGAPNGAIGPAAIRRRSLPGHHPARLGLGAPQDATGAERCAVSVGPVDRMFATPPDSPGQCEPGLSDDRPRDLGPIHAARSAAAAGPVGHLRQPLRALRAGTLPERRASSRRPTGSTRTFSRSSPSACGRACAHSLTPTPKSSTRSSLGGGSSSRCWARSGIAWARSLVVGSGR